MELAAGTALLVGVSFGAVTLASWTESRIARAAEAQKSPGWDLQSSDQAAIGSVPPVGLFLGVSDDVLLAPIKTGKVETVKYNRGGSSISLRIDFDNGARAAFKPVQLIEHTVPRREVAAYRINRLLGLSSVPPAVGRKLPYRDLIANLRSDSRIFTTRMREEMAISDGMVPGELSWWIPVIAIARVGNHPIDSVEGIVTWTRYLTAGKPIAHDDYRLVRQISDLVVFDFVIDNVDRWSGGNVRMSEGGRVLYFMDNTASFGTGRPGSGRTRAYLHRTEKFSRSLISSLAALNSDRVRVALTPDGDAFPELLRDDEIDSLLARRDFVLDYVEKLISTHGREAVMVFP